VGASASAPVRIDAGRRGARQRGAVLVEQLLEETARDGADLALFFQAAGPTSPVPDGFAVVPTTDVELTVTESSRDGAPMALVRGGENRDFQAITAAACIAIRVVGLSLGLSRQARWCPVGRSGYQTRHSPGGG
jgi:hypothetical protein